MQKFMHKANHVCRNQLYLLFCLVTGAVLQEDLLNGRDFEVAQREAFGIFLVVSLVIVCALNLLGQIRLCFELYKANQAEKIDVVAIDQDTGAVAVSPKWQKENPNVTVTTSPMFNVPTVEPLHEEQKVKLTEQLKQLEEVIKEAENNESTQDHPSNPDDGIYSSNEPPPSDQDDQKRDNLDIDPDLV
jgi:hypothetical protein